MAKQRIDKTLLARKIQELDGLSKEEKSELIGLLNRRQYGLVWEDKPEDVEERLRRELPVLKEVKERAIISDDPAAPNHILIEGDNLEALVALTYTHPGKIDVIYIDPPYNTGNKDFIYNDAYIASEDSFRHSKWITFMQKRLKLAKNLLSDDGVIFISIDDNEYATLKMLCDEVFLEKNFIATLVWKSKSGGANDSRYFAVDHEYILVYARESEKLNIELDSEATVTTSYNRRDEKGEYALDRLDKQSIRYSASLDYEIIGPDGQSYKPQHKDPNNPNATWRWSKEHVEEAYDELVFENGCVYTKNYKKEGAIARSLLLEERFGRTRTGKTELFSIIGQNPFNNPKPSKLISYLIKLHSKKNSTVLDFFAGSGSTLNAVLNLNAIDGGKRTCILCTNNENDICTNITYPRIANIIKGYTSKGKKTEELYSEALTISKLKKSQQYLDKVERIKKEYGDRYDSVKTSFEDGVLTLTGEYDKNEPIPGFSNNSLRYYKTAFIPRNNTLKNLRNLVAASTELLCIKEDLYDEKESFGNIKLDKRRARYFEHGCKRMLVICDESLLYDFIDEIRQMELDSRIKVYVFSDSSYAYDDDFEEVYDKVEVCALPAAILAAYKEVLPPRAELDADGNFVEENPDLTDDAPDGEGDASSREDSGDEPFKTTLF